MPGNGSGIWNGEQGKVIFKEAVSMSRCGTLVSRSLLNSGIFVKAKSFITDICSWQKLARLVGELW